MRIINENKEDEENEVNKENEENDEDNYCNGNDIQKILNYVKWVKIQIMSFQMLISQ